MSVHRFFQIWDEVVLEGKDKLKYMKSELIANIVLKILEEENKDRRTLEISGKKPKMITDKQKQYLKDLGYKNYENIASEKASKLIDELKSRRKK